MSTQPSAGAGALEIGDSTSSGVPGRTTSLVAEIKGLLADNYLGMAPSPECSSWGVFGYDSQVIVDLKTWFTRGTGNSELKARPFVDRDRRFELLEFRYPIGPDLVWLGAWWGRSFSLWRSMTPEYIVRAVFAHLNAATWDSDASLMAVLGSFGDGVSKYADFLAWERPMDWQFCCHLKLLGGYQATAKSDEMLEDVLDWVNTPRVHTSLFGTYHEEFGKTLRRWFVPTKSSDFSLSFKDYLSSRAVWARSGSSTTRVDTGLAKTKWNLAWSKDDIQIRAVMSRVGKKTDLVHSLIQKLELGKVRGVIGVDDAMYLAMDYISQFVEDDLAHTPMFNFQSEEKQQSTWEMLGSAGTKVPLDESGFDHDKSDTEVLSCVDACVLFAKMRAKPAFHPDIEYCGAFVKRFIFGGFIKVGETKVTVNKGVLSGWRWTYLVDTMINVTQINLCLAELVQAGCGLNLKFVCSGDDVGCVFPNFREAGAFFVAYRSYGYKVNAAKFWVSKWRNEFLRITVTGAGVRGYVNRMLPKLLFTNPLQTAVSREEKVSSLVAVWSKVYVRGWAKRDVLNCVYADIAGSLRVSLSNAKRFVHTPVAYGGGGAWPYTGEDGLGLHFSKGDDESRVRLASLPGAMDYVSYLTGKYGERELFERGVLEVVEGTLTYKKAKVKSTPVFTPVFVPDPLGVGRDLSRRSFKSWVPRELMPFNTLVTGDMLDTTHIPSFVDKTVWLNALQDVAGWTEGARRLWLVGKLPATAVYFTGRDTVRTSAAHRIAFNKLRNLKRVNIELMRRVCYSATVSVASLELPGLDWAE